MIRHRHKSIQTYRVPILRVASKHAREDVNCTDCHYPRGSVQETTHQLLNPVIDLCTECHMEKTISKHAPKVPTGATCATCHMPGGSHKFTEPAKK